MYTKEGMVKNCKCKPHQIDTRTDPITLKLVKYCSICGCQYTTKKEGKMGLKEVEENEAEKILTHEEHLLNAIFEHFVKKGK